MIKKTISVICSVVMACGLYFSFAPYHHADSATKRQAFDAKPTYAKQAQPAHITTSEDHVAVMRLFVRYANEWYYTGHAFLTIQNISDKPIQVGHLTHIQPNTTVSIATRDNKYHAGVHYNAELWFVGKLNLEAYEERISIAKPITQTELDALSTYIVQNDDYRNLATNCVTFASGGWVAAGGEPLFTGVYADIPWILRLSIEQLPDHRINEVIPYDYLPVDAHGNPYRKE